MTWQLVTAKCYIGLINIVGIHDEILNCRHQNIVIKKIGDVQMPMLKEGSNWGKWDLHIHTESSHDYSYSGEKYSDEGLVQAWKEKGFLAVAITDHFKIDGDRIKRLQELANKENITVFPGVEYRTSHGHRNVHIISIFSNKMDVLDLGNAFHYSMIKEKAGNPENHTTIYWELKDIVEFNKKNNGVLTVHAGGKASGIDQTMKSDPEFFNAIKLEYASIVDAFEVNNLHSFNGYKKNVLPVLKSKFEREFAVIVSSDNHDYNDYKTSTNLWIKADPTFEGLKQAFLHPAERIFIGEKPEKVIHEETNPKSIMKSIKISKKENAQNEFDWFNTEIPLNSGLVSIIGNKGSGKSALSDILGVVNNSANIKMLSFLNSKRFNKSPDYYGKDYMAELTWLDQESAHLDSLYIEQNENDSPVTTAQYLPQKYIEEVCSNLDNSIFQSEINKLIFSYISQEEKLGAENFEEFIILKTESIESELKPLYEELGNVNQVIIKLEEKKKVDYQTALRRKKDERKSDLFRQIAAEPEEIPKPVNSDSNDQLDKVESIGREIEELITEIDNVKKDFESHNVKHQKLITLNSEITLLINEIEQKNSEIEKLFNEFDDAASKGFKIEFTNPIMNYNNEIDRIQREKDSILNILRSEDGLESRLRTLNSEKQKALELIDYENKTYQTYLADRKSWEDTVKEIQGSTSIQGSLEYYEAEYKYLQNDLSNEYIELLNNRIGLIKRIYDKKIEKKDIFDNIYGIIDDEIKKILGQLNQDIQFKTRIVIKEEKVKTLLNYVNKRARSRFQGSEESKKELAKILSDLDESDINSVTNFINNLLECGIEEDYDQLDRVIHNKAEYYEGVTSLKFLEVDYHLTYDGNTVNELSPGERGLMLLVFYLSLSRNDKPIIIDQPEDNLDNQSVYSRLVPCIVAAKKGRQVIVVTHNPNIAIACDAEQIIVADIDKANNKIQYVAGSIESEIINNKIVEILEGTKPAFKLRGSKYIN